MSDPNGYIVGWICAITAEFLAAKTMPDVVYEGPEHVATQLVRYLDGSKIRFDNPATPE